MRDIKIDVLKGFAIICVVIGHIIQGSIINYDENIVFRFIYSFHMPLFFFLSGYVHFSDKQFEIISFLKKRLLSLMLPFLSWTLFSSIIYKVGIDNFMDKFIYPDTGYWFLPVLFCCMLLLACAKLLSKFDVPILLSIAIIMLFVDVVFGIRVLGFNFLAKSFPFFIVGYSAKKYSGFLNRTNINIWKYVAIVFAVGVTFWMRKEPPLFYQYINLGSIFALGYKFIVAILGIMFFYGLVVRVIAKTNNEFRVLQFLGKNSLIIYIVHFFFLPFFDFILIHQVYYISVLIFGVICIYCSLGLNYLFTLNQVLSLIFLGKRKEILKDQ